MGVKIDLTGKKFGYLTVLKESDIAGQWVCECECGAIVIKKGEYLRNGDTKSCGGAIHRGKQLQGQRFGYLTVIEHVGYRNKEKLWRCLCDCGNYTEVRGGSLTSGRTKSCGCYNKQLSKERLSKINPYKDLSNQTFGLLTPIKIYDSDKRGEKRWLCQCSCGNTCIVLGSNLRTGHTQSCGCLRISHGELSIKNLLESNNIKFIMY